MPFLLMAQETKTIKGIVKDKETNKIISYVNLGIVDKGIGTVSNIDGEFELLIGKTEETEILLFSHIGYEDFQLDLAKNKSSFLEIEMIPQAVDLDEIIVKGTNPAFIGTKNLNEPVTGFFNAKGLGGEVGTCIKNDENCTIKSFGIHIVKNTFEKVKFRINFYTTAKRKPKRLIQANEYLEVENGQLGDMIVDVKDFNIDSDIFVSIELIEFEKGDDEKPDFFYAAYQNKKSKVFYKFISLDKWRKKKGFDLCFWLNVEK